MFFTNYSNNFIDLSIQISLYLLKISEVPIIQPFSISKSRKFSKFIEINFSFSSKNKNGQCN